MTDRPQPRPMDTSPDTASERTPEFIADIRVKLAAVPPIDHLWRKRRLEWGER